MIFFYLINELITCNLLSVFTGAGVRCYETKRKLILQWLPENRKKATQTKKGQQVTLKEEEGKSSACAV